MCLMNNPTVQIQVNTMQNREHRAVYNTACNREEKWKQLKGATVEHINTP